MSRSVPIRVRRARPIAAVALLGAAALLAACGTTASSSNDGAINGLDADSVTIGYTVVDGGKLKASLGFHSIDTGDAALHHKMIQAYVDYANANGGFGGRQGEPAIQDYISANASAGQSQSTCNAFTQDLKVFAAVLDGMYETNVLPCFKGANTLMLDATLIAHDQAEFESNSPYLWSPTYPEYGGFVKAQLTALSGEGFFDGATGVQVLAVDNEVARRVATTVVQPYLAQAGITKSPISYIDSTDQGTLGATSSEAIASGKSAGVNRVVTVGGARVMPVALADFGAKDFASTWSVSSWDSPIFLQENGDSLHTARIQNTSGFGFIPAYDVDAAQGGVFPDPARPAETVCKSIMDAAGIVPGEGLRANYRAAFQYCDATMFLKAALDKAPAGDSITGAQFKDAVAQIGTGYASSMTFGSSLGPNQYAATNAGRVLVYDATCACFQYKGENVTISAD